MLNDYDARCQEAFEQEKRLYDEVQDRSIAEEYHRYDEREYQRHKSAVIEAMLREAEAELKRKEFD